MSNETQSCQPDASSENHVRTKKTVFSNEFIRGLFMSDHQDDLTHKIRNGKSVLVLGQAYLSLIEKQIDDFVDPLLKAVNVQIKKDGPKNLSHIYQLLLDRGFSEDEILGGLQKASEAIPISENIQILVQVPWRAIFFSGIDEILSRAILSCVPKRGLRTVYDRDTQFSDIRNSSYYYTIWLEGCVNQREPRMWPAITKRGTKGTGLINSLTQPVSLSSFSVARRSPLLTA